MTKPKKKFSIKKMMTKPKKENHPVPKVAGNTPLPEVCKRVLEKGNKPSFPEGQPEELLDYRLDVEGLTQSLLTTWRKCPTKARLNMLGLYKPASGLPLAFGSIFHQALDFAYNKIKEGHYSDADDVLNDTDTLVSMTEQFFEEEYNNCDADGQQTYETSYAMTEAVLPAYFHEWRHDFFGDEKIEWVDIEKEWSFKDPDSGIMMRGKFDGVFRDARGRLWLFETKTKSSWNEDNLSLLIERELQVQVYLLAMEYVYGERPAGVLYNLVRRPQLRQKKTESKPSFYQRIQEDMVERPTFYFTRLKVSINEAQMKLFRLRFQAEMKRFRAWFRSAPSLDAQHTHECVGIYGACPFLKLCSEDSYDGLHVKTAHHSELDYNKESK